MQKKTQKFTIENLYPQYSAEEQDEAKETIKAYVNLVWKIYNRLKAEGKLDLIETLRLRQEWEKRNKKS